MDFSVEIGISFILAAISFFGALKMGQVKNEQVMQQLKAENKRQFDKLDDISRRLHEQETNIKEKIVVIDSLKSKNDNIFERINLLEQTTKEKIVVIDGLKEKMVEINNMHLEAELAEIKATLSYIRTMIEDMKKSEN